MQLSGIPGAGYCAAGANGVSRMANAVGNGICTAGYAVTGAAAHVINRAACVVQNNPKFFIAGAGLALITGTALAYRAGKFAGVKDSACSYCGKAKAVFEQVKAWFPVSQGALQAKINALEAEQTRIKTGVRDLAAQCHKDAEVILPMVAPAPTPGSPSTPPKDNGSN